MVLPNCAKARAVLGVLALLATAAHVPHLGNVTVPSQPRGGLLGTVLSAALHVDGTGEDEARTLVTREPNTQGGVILARYREKKKI